MTTGELIDFEGLVPKYGMVKLDFYDGLTWKHTRVEDKAGQQAHGPNGYLAVTHQRAFAFNESGIHTVFSSTTTFSLDFGHFAAAWNTGMTLLVRGYLDGVRVAQQVFTIDQVDTKLHFSNAFAHIDEVHIKTFGGTDGTGDGTGAIAGFDNIHLTFDGDIPTGPSTARAAPPGHGDMHSALADALLHASDGALHGVATHLGDMLF